MILDFRGFDSNIILILRAGILMPIGTFPEVLSKQILVGIILVGRLGVSLLRPYSSKGCPGTERTYAFEETSGTAGFVSFRGTYIV